MASVVFRTIGGRVVPLKVPDGTPGAIPYDVDKARIARIDNATERLRQTERDLRTMPRGPQRDQIFDDHFQAIRDLDREGVRVPPKNFVYDMDDSIRLTRDRANRAGESLRDIALGGTIGSVVPGVGTAVGAALGGWNGQARRQNFGLGIPKSAGMGAGTK